MGGIATIFLTHRDDVADHEEFASHFRASCIMHKDDGAAHYGVERIIEGADAVRLDDDFLVIPTPGHTRGHAVLLYRDKYLFTGDHLAWSPNRKSLTAFRSVCWYSWDANRLDGETARLLFRMGLAWTRSDAPRHRGGHAQTSRRLRGVDEVCEVTLGSNECLDWL